MKLNIGCGTDYREGFVNIDGSSSLPKVDRVIDINTMSLKDVFEPDTADFILANDIVEHHFHWEAVKLLRDFYEVLRMGGELEIRVPDTEHIIKNWRIPMERKLVLLYGGQDIPQKIDSEMDKSRKQYPQYFCHKYGWTRNSMTRELLRIGFSSVTCKRAHTNFIANAIK